MLVIITDTRSSSTEIKIRQAAGRLEDKGIHVISVALGNEADPRQLEAASQDKTDVITAPGDVDPTTLGERIMNKAKQRKFTNDRTFCFQEALR